VGVSVTARDSWKYYLAKEMKRRAETFRERATSNEERAAWRKVIDWLDTILENRRYVSASGVICLYDPPKLNELP
jgi:hypothetical protein